MVPLELTVVGRVTDSSIETTSQDRQFLSVCEDCWRVLVIQVYSNVTERAFTAADVDASSDDSFLYPLFHGFWPEQCRHGVRVFRARFWYGTFGFPDGGLFLICYGAQVLILRKSMISLSLRRFVAPTVIASNPSSPKIGSFFGTLGGSSFLLCWSFVNLTIISPFDG